MTSGERQTETETGEGWIRECTWTHEWASRDGLVTRGILKGGIPSWSQIELWQNALSIGIYYAVNEGKGEGLRKEEECNQSISQQFACVSASTKVCEVCRVSHVYFHCQD